MSNHDYSPEQIKIIDGLVPPEDIHSQALQRLKEKAIKNNDNNVVNIVNALFEARPKRTTRKSPRQSTNTQYTEKQLQYVRGIKSIDEASAYELSWFYPKALANGDEELANIIKERLEFVKKEAQAREAQRRRERKRKVRGNIPIEWKQPKTNEYTKHQKAVVGNEIPLSSVHTNELISIYMKANNIGDCDLAAIILDEIYKRRTNERAVWIKDIKRRRRSISSYCGELPMLTWQQQALILGDMHWDEYTISEIEKTISLLKEFSDHKALVIAQKILYFKQNPNAKYRITSCEEARDLLQRLFEAVLDKPSDWKD